MSVELKLNRREDYRRFASPIILEELWPQISIAKTIHPYFGHLSLKFDGGKPKWVYISELREELQPFSFIVEGKPALYRIVSRLNRIFSPRFPSNPTGVFFLPSDSETWLLLRINHAVTPDSSNGIAGWKYGLKRLRKGIGSLDTPRDLYTQLHLFAQITPTVLYKSTVAPNILEQVYPPQEPYMMKGLTQFSRKF